MSRSKLLYIAVVVSIVIVGLLLFFLNDIAPPALSLQPESKTIGARQNITVTLADTRSNIKSAKVTVAQKGQSFVILNRDFTTREKTQKLTFTLNQANLSEGKFDLIITATDTSWANLGQGNTVTQRLPFQLDTKPPRINVTSPAPSVRRGSVTAIAYTLSKKASKTGIQIGEYFFPAHLQKNGKYYVFFPFPMTMTADTFKPELVAHDLAGNIAKTRIIVNAINHTYPHSTLRISDNFLRAKMPAFVNDVPDAKNDLERYIAVNSQVRLDNEKTLLGLVEKTAPTMLWSGTMQRLPRSAVRARFGDDRTYTYNNETIDRQTHMGLDIASTANAPIPAANNGIVIFTGDLGIFGNIVVIDHGLGLMTLYSHMSKILANINDTVKKGDILGHTGSTGLAGGDHLHFGVLVGGLQVQPTDWFDKKWIDSTILNRLALK